MTQMGTDLLTSSGDRTLDTEPSRHVSFFRPLLAGALAPAWSLWVEEGYTVIEILESGLKRENVLRLAIKALARHDKCAPNDMISIHMAPNYGKSYTVFLASLFSEEK
ncbi:hypothetical protein ASPTUDRAFT_195311 [Aspergillus tubingensis CBS 134.48]|uniref:Uncharacterized protein n=1 Tax=Aspergillus tubingensis (strain CBS 134.48) TaxID=767770 RepID=A0A1L9NKU3_ASPTC|nr:hypothetical protein ASPTUDRAFT_195311 [Aspergillus tubingensis CBS 134.48]